MNQKLYAALDRFASPNGYGAYLPRHAGDALLQECRHAAFKGFSLRVDMSRSIKSWEIGNTFYMEDHGINGYFLVELKAMEANA